MSDATSVVAASVLFWLEEEFCVLQVERVDGCETWTYRICLERLGRLLS
jgi:hypothetical protein